MQNEEILHFGIKGMHWGIRRTPEQLGHKPAKSKNVKDMSDKELNDAINRMSKEKQYKQLLSEQNPKKTSRVKKVMGDILENAVKTVASKAVERMANNMFKEPAVVKNRDYYMKLDPKTASETDISNGVKFFTSSQLFETKVADIKLSQAESKAVQDWLEKAESTPYRDIHVTIDDDWLKKH